MPVIISWSVLVRNELQFSYSIDQEALYFQHRFYIVPPLARQQDTNDVEFIYRQANIRWMGNARYGGDSYGYGYSYGYSFGTSQHSSSPSDLLPVLEL